MKLYAISDLHVGFTANRQALEALAPHPEDWIILGGDLGETEAHLTFVLRLFCARFARVLWVPGNHELWSVRDEAELRGERRYQRFVELCREHGVITPEDPYPLWPGPGEPCVLAPLFLLYDYSFRPDDVPESEALAWARAAGLECADEVLLHPDPFPSRQAWCHARCDYSERRLAAIPESRRTVLINHFPLRRDLAILPAIPRFSIWCGTRRTEDWHRRFRAEVVVYGHLHIPRTQRRDGVRFEEVSFGYPRQRRPKGSGAIEDYLREILPGPSEIGSIPGTSR